MKRYTFGSYPHDGSRENITWLILEETGREAKLISEYILDANAFGRSGCNGWEDSSLREWLQDDFLNNAFTEEQQDALVEMMCECEQRNGQEILDTDYSFDNVTLLSLDEVCEFFPSEDERIAKATQYAQNEGVEIEYAADCCGWWLRSPCVKMGSLTGWNACVMANGTVKPWGVYTGSIGIRPVITINLDLAASCQYDMVEDDEEDDDLLAAIERLQQTLEKLGIHGNEDDKEDEDEDDLSLYDDSDDEDEDGDEENLNQPVVLRTITDTLDVNDAISILIPAGFICEEKMGKDGKSIFQIKAGLFTDDDGESNWRLEAHITEVEMQPDENNRLYTGMDLIEQGIKNAGSTNHIKFPGQVPAAFIAAKTPLNFAGNIIKLYTLMLALPWTAGKTVLIQYACNITHGTDDLSESYRLFLELAKAVRINGQKISLNATTVNDMLHMLVPSFDENEEGVCNAKVAIKVNGEESGFITYNADGSVTHEMLEDIPVTAPPGHLYAHYRQVQPPNLGMPNVTWVINANGTEFAPLGLEMCLKSKNQHELLNIVQEYKRNDSYSADCVRDMAEVFAVDMTVFSHQHDRFSEILAGNLQKCYTFSSIRSFAWTLGEMAERAGRSIDDYSTDELLRIIDFIADQKWLNYESSGPFKALCDHPDLHVMYVPAKLCSNNYSVKLRKALSQMPVVSLDDFRECLMQLYEPMRKLTDYLSAERDPLQPLTGNAADVLYAWCALCVAAEEPFISEDGPMMCAWNYPGNQDEYIMFRVDGKTPEQRKQEKAQKKAKWLEDYGPYISNQPLITISGKKFVFTGLGVLKDEQKEHPIVQKVVAQGGLYRSSISGVTDYLVVGDADPGESKIRNAIEQQKAGKPIQIIRLQTLEDIFASEQPSGQVDDEDASSEELMENIAPETASSIQEKLDKLGKGIADMQDALEQYSEFQRLQEEQKQRREQELQAARDSAVAEASTDEACMFIVLTIIDKLKLTEKYDSAESFFDCYGEDFPAYDSQTLWKLRNNVDNSRRVAEQQQTYTRNFMKLDVEKRFSWTVTAIVNISPVFDIEERFNQAMQMSAKWFTDNEGQDVQAELKKLQHHFRESLRSQFYSLCADWRRWDTAKRLLFVEYSDAPSSYNENTLCQQVGDSNVTLALRSSRSSMIVTQVLNWYAWYWGRSCQEVWLTAYRNRFDAQGRPTKDEYVSDQTSYDDTTATRLCKALDALGIPYQPLSAAPASVPFSEPAKPSPAPASARPAPAAAAPKKEGCYIATAVYGSYDAPEVLTLRRFRDETLRRTALGRLFIRTYYRLSPPVAQRLKNAKRINGLVRSLLDHWVCRLEKKQK